MSIRKVDTEIREQQELINSKKAREDVATRREEIAKQNQQAAEQSVQISSASRELSALLQDPITDEVRSDLVAKYKAKIASGDYKVDGEKLAEVLIRDLL